MNIEPFEKELIEKLRKNFSNFENYFLVDINVFYELQTLIFETNKCLLLEFNNASITLTNHLLERLLKLALIYNETGIGPTSNEDWNTEFSGPNEKYSSINLSKSIDLCKKYGLISENEKRILFDTIRDLMRNGFSHADTTIILSKHPDKMVGFQGSLSNPTGIKKVILNPKVIPFLQAIQIEDFVRQMAKPYFEYVIGLLINIEKRLMEKQK